MPRAELKRMGIAFAVATAAVSFLALDAIVDVNSSAITKRIETAQSSIVQSSIVQSSIVQSSIVKVAMSQHELASAVQAWARRGHQKQPSAIE
ncbi:hypothetical protein G8O24_23365 [Bradyrhizobium sp. INPA01-394B]|uniref:Uncharacterized protein n=1 Tax=Bradyrhizobium campsiandrae TaxID=1729892 RepID=A0ABR7U4D0_9BRAD|nr:hypothetical protein [Bradyrhizobium campsiandrae]MBC9880269.1 hypothetical protein [Bradyrhizobium campsiandrae]MBC9978420.1 hypothetical protein [Bradyrhizobium campsiandrae]